MPAGTWYPGQVWPGWDVRNVPTVFAKPVVFQGTTPATSQGGFSSDLGLVTSPPVITSPGTVATGGTVTNSTGWDAMVYASATTGISSVKIGTAVVAGSALSGQTVSYYVYAGNTITVDYTGNLTWNWLAV